MRILSLNWSRSFLGFWDDVAVGLEFSTIFLPLSGGTCIMMLCNIKGIIQQIRRITPHTGVLYSALYKP